MTDPTPPPVTPYWTPPPPQHGYGYPVGRPTNGMAIAALVVSIIALPSICAYGIGGLVFGLVGAILGHVARKQIRARDEQGEGMALAGIIMGWIAVGLSVLLIIGLVLLFVYGVDWDAVNNGTYEEYDDAIRAMLRAAF